MRVKESTIHLPGLVSQFVLCKSDNNKCMLVSPPIVPLSQTTNKSINLFHWRKSPYLDTFVNWKKKLELNAIDMPVCHYTENTEYVQRFWDAWLGFGRQIRQTTNMTELKSSGQSEWFVRSSSTLIWHCCSLTHV